MTNFRTRGRLVHLAVPPNTACTPPSARPTPALTPGASVGQSGNLRGLRLIPLKYRYLVPPTSTPVEAYPYRELRKRKPLALYSPNKIGGSDNVSAQ